MPTRNRRPHPLRFEGLESRNLMDGDVNNLPGGISILAGDVTVAVVDGELQITGDSADNHIQISQTGKAWIVEGIDTTINGNSTPQSFLGVTDIAIDLGAGNDSTKVTQGKLRSGAFELRDDDGSTVVHLTKLSANVIDVRTHNVSDTINLEKCEADIGAIVTSPTTGDDAADAVTVLDSEFKTQLAVLTGDGDDAVSIQDVIVGGVCLVRTYTTGESDQDTVSMTKVRAKHELMVETGDGADTITLSDVHSRSEDLEVIASQTAADTSVDKVQLDKATARRKLTVVTGDGADEVTLNKCAAGSRLYILTAGTTDDTGDLVSLTDTKGGENIVIDTGDGTDEAELVRVVAELALGVNLGEGDSDRLQLDKSRGFRAHLVGGDGLDDGITQQGNKWKQASLNVTEFEWTAIG